MLEEIMDSLSYSYSLEELRLKDEMLFIITTHYGISNYAAQFILKGAEGLREIRDEVSRCISCDFVLH